MPRAYAETHPNGLPIDRNVQAAIDGFLALGYDITNFTRDDITQDKFWRVASKNPFVGSILTISQHLANLEKVPERIDYPLPLKSHLHRSVDQMPLVAYTLDVATTITGSTPLIEANDFWSMSSYGLDSVTYAEMLRDRYFEIVI